MFYRYVYINADVHTYLWQIYIYIYIYIFVYTCTAIRIRAKTIICDKNEEKSTETKIQTQPKKRRVCLLHSSKKLSCCWLYGLVCVGMRRLHVQLCIVFGKNRKQIRMCSMRLVPLPPYVLLPLSNVSLTLVTVVIVYHRVFVRHFNMKASKHELHAQPQWVHVAWGKNSEEQP